MKPVIRSATSEDLELCLRLSGTVKTDHVYQLTQREQDEQIVVSLSSVRLPRTMDVEYPRSSRDILETWKKTDALIVAEDNGQIHGFIDIQAEPWNDNAWVKNLIVASHHRWQGIGTALLASADHWTRKRGLQALMVEAQSQNWPAIRFYRKNGFAFCGFNDRYYTNQIALFFTKRVK